MKYKNPKLDKIGQDPNIRVNNLKMMSASMFNAKGIHTNFPNLLA